MKLLLRWILNAALLLAIARYLNGIALSGFYSALITALILGLINAVIKPILVFLTLPVNILTLGLFTLVINGFLFWLTGTIVQGFEVTWFWPAFWGALLMTVGSWIIGNVLNKD